MAQAPAIADDERSGLTGWVLAITRAMRDCGIDSAAVLEEIGMDQALFQGGYSRYSQEQISRLWRMAIELSGDPAFGLRVAAQVRPGTFHVVGYAMSCSATLGRALHRLAFYCRLISDSTTATLTEVGDTAVLEFIFDTGGEPLIYQTVDTVLAAILGFARWISGEPIEPLEIRLQHQTTAEDAAYREFFGIPITYGCAQNCIVFHKADLDSPIMAADEELASLLDTVANRYLEKRMSGRIAVRVRDVLIAGLPAGAIAKSDVARQLNMTERTLLRRLKMEGTTFVDVLNDVRQEMSFQLLQRPGLTVTDVAYMLGFSDENTFSRAFKRWTGRRPGAITRERKHGKAEGQD